MAETYSRLVRIVASSLNPATVLPSASGPRCKPFMPGSDELRSALLGRAEEMRECIGRHLRSEAEMEVGDEVRVETPTDGKVRLGTLSVKGRTCSILQTHTENNVSKYLPSSFGREERPSAQSLERSKCMIHSMSYRVRHTSAARGPRRPRRFRLEKPAD